MARIVEKIATLTIANGATESDAITSAAYNTKIVFGALVDMIIYAPSALTGTVTVQVAPVEAPASGDWVDLYVGATAMTLAAGTANVIPAAPIRALRVKSSAAEGASRAFPVVGQFDVTC